MDSVRPACPRCGGITDVEEDGFGAFVSCIACGWLQDVRRPPRPRAVSRPGEDDFWERLRKIIGSEAVS